MEFSRDFTAVSDKKVSLKPFHGQTSIAYPLFSLTQEAQMKTASLRSVGGASAALRLAKKKCVKGDFASAEATDAPRVGSAVAFFQKAT